MLGDGQMPARKISSDERASENYHIRIQKDDLHTIRDRIDRIKALSVEMRELGVMELPEKTMGKIISRALVLYADKVAADLDEARKSAGEL